MKQNLELLANELIGISLPGEVRVMDGFNCISYTWSIDTHSKKAFFNSPFKKLQEYFGHPIKKTGVPVVVPVTLPQEYVRFVNMPISRLLGTIAINLGFLTPNVLYRILAEQEGGSFDPLVDLTNRQALYGRMVKEPGEQGRIIEVELAKVCPFRKDTPSQKNGENLTITLSGFYLPTCN